MASIHVIDPEESRRARISTVFKSRELHVEIYDSLREFANGRSFDGCILAADDPVHCAPKELVELLATRFLFLPIVLYAVRPSPATIVDGMLAGAIDYLEWPFEPALLERAIGRMLASGQGQVQTRQRRLSARKSIERLSPRELQVLENLVKGASNKDIAAVLGISPRTVEIHRANMMTKLQAQSPGDAVRLAFHAGFAV